MVAENTTVLPDRIPDAPPPIAPVPAHVRRPQWSVMIPTYNCLLYLREALESVLTQDPGPEQMQIAVVDDCSTDGDVAALVQAIGQGRVEYFRQPVNRGSLRNFETCLNRATGHWVHLLHGDDRVKPGFYAEIAMLFGNHPEAGAAFTNIIHIEVTGNDLFVSTPLMETPGVLDDFLVRLAGGQVIQPPSMVVKREVYEQLGSFFAVHYGEDWEMWARIAAHFPIAYSPKCLAHYRYLNEASITLRSLADGQNVRDIAKVIDIIQGYLPLEHRKRLKKAAQRHYSVYSVSLANDMYYTNPKSAFAQTREALRMSTDIKVLYLAMKLYVKDWIHYKQLKRLWGGTVPTGRP